MSKVLPRAAYKQKAVIVVGTPMLCDAVFLPFLSKGGRFLACIVTNPAPPRPLMARPDNVEIFESYMTFSLLPKTKIMWHVRINLVCVFIQSIMPSEARPTQNENLFFLIVYIYINLTRVLGVNNNLW